MAYEYDYRDPEALSDILSQGFSIPNIEARDHLLKLQQDPDYLKQIQMGDIEFEMDMMNDMLYGKPSIEKPNGDVMNQNQLDRLNELDSILGTQTGDVDELGIAALRDWSMNTDPLKYTDPSPYSLDMYKDGEYFGEYLDRPHHMEDYFGAHYGDKIDLNMKNIMSPPYQRYDPHELGNRISDVYRHELKHGIVNNEEAYSHPAIYGTNARFGLSRNLSQGSSQSFRDPGTYPQNPFHPSQYEGRPHREAYSEDRAGDYVRENIAAQNKRTFRREPTPRPEGRTHHFSTGGLVSLMI